MKCPACGIWNRKGYTYCFRCGAPLNEPEEIPESEQPVDEWSEEELSEERPSRAEKKARKRGGLRGLFGRKKREREKEDQDEYDWLDNEDPWAEQEASPAEEEAVLDASEDADESVPYDAAYDEYADEPYEDEEASYEENAGEPAADENEDSEEDEDEDGPIVMRSPASAGTPAPKAADDEDLRFHPLEQQEKPAPVRDLSEYEDNIDLYDYTNWDSDGELDAEEEALMQADETAEKDEQSAAEEEAVPYPEAEEIEGPAADSEEAEAEETPDDEAAETEETAEAADEGTEEAEETEAEPSREEIGETRHYPPVGAREHHNVEVLVPAQTLSKTARSQFRGTDISREIIEAINTQPNRMEPAPEIQEPRPRRLMSLSRVSPEERASVLRPEPYRKPEPSNKPEPQVVTLDKLPAGESRPTDVGGGEPFDMKDEYPTQTQQPLSPFEQLLARASASENKDEAPKEEKKAPEMRPLQRMRSAEAAPLSSAPKNIGPDDDIPTQRQRRPLENIPLQPSRLARPAVKKQPEPPQAEPAPVGSVDSAAAVPPFGREVPAQMREERSAPVMPVLDETPAAEQPVPEAEAPAQPVQEEAPAPAVERPEWATNALRELNLLDTPLERHSREARSGASMDVLEMEYSAPQRRRPAPSGASQTRNQAPERTTPPLRPRSAAPVQEQPGEYRAPARRPSGMSASNAANRSASAPVSAPRREAPAPERRPASASYEAPARRSYAETGDLASARRSAPSSDRPAPRRAPSYDYSQPERRPLSSDGQQRRRPASSAPIREERRVERDSAALRSRSASAPARTSSRVSAPERTSRNDETAMRIHSSRSREPERPIERVNMPVKRGSRRNPVRLAITGLIALILLALLIWGLVAGIRAIFSGGDEETNEQQNVQDQNVPVVAAAKVNGNPGHTITFYGKDGDIVYIGEPINENITIVGGIGVLQIEDSKLIGDQVATSDVNVTLNPVLRDGKSGSETQMDPIELVVTPPDAKLELIAPASGTEEVNISTYQLRFCVDLGSTVFVGDNDVSDLISDQADNAGVVNYNVEVEPIGDNHITITVRSPGCKETKKTVTLYRAPREIPLELDSDTPTESTSKKLTISGTVADGASIKVTSGIDGDVTMGEDGKFSFTAVLNNFGDNTVTIVASKDGKEDIPFTHVITYNPTADDYTRLGREMDYNNLLNNVGRVYECYGEIEEILYDGTGEEPFTFIYNVGTTSTPQHIYMEMTKKDSYPTTGQRYKIYADVVGETDDGLPSMKARYWYND